MVGEVACSEDEAEGACVLIEPPEVPLTPHVFV